MTSYVPHLLLRRRQKIHISTIVNKEYHKRDLFFVWEWGMLSAINTFGKAGSNACTMRLKRGPVRSYESFRMSNCAAWFIMSMNMSPFIARCSTIKVLNRGTFVQWRTCTHYLSPESRI